MPIVDWETAERRFVIPGDIQEILGADTNLFRVPQFVDRKQHRKHHTDLEFYENVQQFIDSSTHWRLQPPEEHKHGSLPRLQLAQLLPPAPGDAEVGLLIVIGYLESFGGWGLFSVHRRRVTWWATFLNLPGIQTRNSGRSPLHPP
jgi:hypothetical protein